MLILAHINLQDADIAAFDQYEEQALALLSLYGARVIERLRSTDSRAEFHLLEFPDAESHAAFLTDPTRAALQYIWESSGASATGTQVVRHT